MKRSAIKTQILIVLFFLISHNLNSQTFTELSTTITGVSSGSSSWGDYDNDGYLDILVVGSGYSKVYRNSGSNTFIEQPGITATLTGVYNASAAWGDYNNDGYLDILLTGTTTGDYTGAITKIYKNNKNNSFSEITGNSIEGVLNGSVAWNDYDNDGDLDFVLMGQTTSNSKIAKIYKNNGLDQFDEQISIQLTGMYIGKISWGDYDNDGWADLIQTGYAQGESTKLYHNNGDDTFTLVTDEFRYDSYYRGASVWNDYDNDGWMDLLLCGGGNYPTNLYLNNSGLNFTRQPGISIPKIMLSSAAWGDCNNDGFADILISGSTNSDMTGRVSKIYTNNGNGTFTEISAGLTGLSNTSVAWGDYDNDGDLDILLSGNDGNSDYTKIYRNDVSSANVKPDAPIGLSSVVSGSNVTLNWQSITSDVTPEKAMTYNIMVGISHDSWDILAPDASSPDGKRRLPAMGNGYLGTTIKLNNLKPDTYYWRVQAVDNGFLGGTFSDEGTFVISTASQAFNLHPSGTGSHQTYLQWSRGTGTQCAVFIKKDVSGTATPLNGSTYSPNPAFGSGNQIGTTGWYCIYVGTKSSVTVSNLEPNTSYVVHICEMTNATTYLSATASNNPGVFITDYFTELVEYVYPGGTSQGNVTWGDYNNDGFLDFFSGENGTPRIYKNNHDNTFLRQDGMIFTGIANGMAAWGDYNNDGFLDLLLIGSGFTKLYKNNAETDGNNTFTDQNTFYVDGVMTGVAYGSCAWADFDNDGDLDIILSGYNDPIKLTKIFRNNGDGTFTEQPGISLPGFNIGKVTVADYNNDGFVDICIGGDLPTGNDTQIYINKGEFIFTLQSQISLGGIYFGNASWGDYDQDGNIDLFLTGMDAGSSLYKNNGDNSFSLIDMPSITSINSLATSAWGDFDNDGYPDLFNSGLSNERAYFTNVYRNDGNGAFVKMNSIHIADIGDGHISLADYDNDGDLDVLIKGNSNGENPFLKIYRNDLTTPNIIPVAPESLTETIERQGVTFRWNQVITDDSTKKSNTYNIRVGKTTGNGEVISAHSAPDGFRRISGNGNMQNNNSFLLKKLSPGNYKWSVQAINNSFKGGSFATERSFTVSKMQAQNLTGKFVDNNSLLLKWERGNGERCAVFCKQGIGDDVIPVDNITYLADNILGYGTQIGAGWYCIYNGRSDSVFLKGLGPDKSYSVHVIEYSGVSGAEEYYTTTSASNPGVFETTVFSEQTSMIFSPKSVFGSAAFGDYNNDDYLDIIVTGSTGGGGVSQLYKNNGNNTFTDENSLPVEGAIHSDAAWADYDNDGSLDLLIAGSNSYQAPYTPFTKLYKNNGNGTGFTEAAVSITGVNFASISWGDYNNDGNVDFAISGATATESISSPVTEIYKNNGDGTFTKLTTTITGAYSGSVAWGDYDNDGDLDLLVVGNITQSTKISKIYQNNGDGNFTEVASLSLPIEGPFSAEWLDFNNDSHLDLIIAGDGIEFYENNGDKTFSRLTGISISEVTEAKIKLADFNGDRRLDFVCSGWIGSTYQTKIFLNNGNNSFSEYPGLSMTGASESALTCGDYDNDGDIDFLLAGFSDGGYFTSMYRNNTIMNAGNPSPNIKPVAPSGLSNTSIPGGVILSWDPVKTNEVNYKNLSYNLEVINTDDNSLIVPSHSMASGKRLIVDMGNCQLDTSFVLKAPQGNYKWKVQAVDQIYAGGSWSAEQTFFVKSVQAFFSAGLICQELPTNFTDESVATNGISSWLWEFGDGTTSNVQNPQHTYAASGNYSVKLTITDTQSFSDFLIQSITVKAKPLSNFSAATVCQGMATSFTNTTNNNGLTVSSWYWDFGDGQTSLAEQPAAHGYLGAADYTVTLKALADNGCRDSITKTVTVSSYPVAAITANAPLTFCKGDSVTLSVDYNSSFSYQWLIEGTALTNADSNRLVTKLAGKFSVAVTNLKGNCKTTSSESVINVKNLPVSPVIESPNYKEGECQGEKPIKLNVNQEVAEYSYQWYRNGVPLSGSTSSFLEGSLRQGDYSLKADLNGCSSVSEIFPLTFLDAPETPEIIANGPTIWYLMCDNKNASSYKWYYNGILIPGAEKHFYLANQDLGKYNVSVSNEKGCFSFSDTIMIPKGITGIDDTDPFEGVKIYPNPTSGTFTIEMNNNILGELIIDILSQNGRKMLNIKFEKSTGHFQSQIDLSGQSRGMYILNLSLDKFRAVRKVMVE